MKFNNAQLSFIRTYLSELAMAEDKALEELKVDPNNYILRERYNVAHAKHDTAFYLAFQLRMNEIDF